MKSGMEVTGIAQRGYVLIFSKHFLILQKIPITNPKPKQNQNTYSKTASPWSCSGPKPCRVFCKTVNYSKA